MDGKSIKPYENIIFSTLNIESAFIEMALAQW